MVRDYSYLLLQMEEQLDYYKALMDKRNRFKDKAMNTDPSSLFDNLNFTSTPLDHAYHAISSLFVNLQIIQKSKGIDVDMGLSRLNLDQSSIEFLQIIEMTYLLGKKMLSNLDLNVLEGNLEYLKGQPKKFERRFVKLIFHSTQHLSQAMLFHALICSRLDEINKE